MVTSNAMARKLTRLEDAHFFRDDVDIRRQFQQRNLCEQQINDLHRVTGIEDRELVAQLADFGFDDKTIEALTLLPLADIAWASGEVSSKERMVATCCVVESELIGNPKAVQVFQSWLRQRPSDELRQLWLEFTNQCTEKMRDGLRLAVGLRLKKQATQIAEASGGYLGIGSVCDAEQQILDLIDHVYRLR